MAVKKESPDAVASVTLGHQVSESEHGVNKRKLSGHYDSQAKDTFQSYWNTYKNYSVNRLKLELKKKGLKTTGKKFILVNRLSNDMTLNNCDTLKRRTVTPELLIECNGKIPPSASNRCQADNEGSSEEEEEKPKFDRAKLKAEQKTLVLWKRPFTTLLYFLKEFLIVSSSFLYRLLECKAVVLLCLLVALMIAASFRITGPHQAVLIKMYKEGLWCVYWLGLGVLSSVGLGTGLHTFLLYLGPHIASVTLAAYECGALNFPEPPYPDQIICPEILDAAWSTSLWNIMRKVKVESIMWGAGTALGELPPYFMARAARLSGYDAEDDDELIEFEELQKKKKDPASMTLVDKLKLSVENIVNKVGFFGILACASVPNPLFDLAGITCGHFLIPFWTFFGATLIGKAFIKMSIQVLFVIIAFNEVLIEKAASHISFIPLVGPYMEAPLTDFLDTQKKKLHSKSNAPQRSSNLSLVFDLLVTAMVVYFLISIINSMAQSYHKRTRKDKADKMER